MDERSLVIYRDAKSSIKAFFSETQTRPDECFVIFSSHGRRALCTKIGGADPLLREGYDVICVQTNCDDWHQNVSVKGIEKLKVFLKQKYRITKGYGSSMGGFGAIAYAERLGFNTVLALCPQYTIAENFDKRWESESKKIVWYQTIEMAAGYNGIIHLVYDPFDLDNKQAKLIIDNFNAANVTSYKVNFGSHALPQYFHDAGVLKRLLFSFAKDYLQIPKVEKKTNKIYLKQLSFVLFQKSKFRWAKATIQRSIELGDERYSVYRLASDISYGLKEFDDAIAFTKQAINAKDNNEQSIQNHKEHLANLLRITGKLDDALNIVDELIHAPKSKFTAYTAKANILLDMQRVKEAKATIRRSIELGDERHSTYRKASDLSHRLQDFDDAIRFAKQAINAKNNNRQSRQNHKVHLANLLRIAGKFDDALNIVDELLQVEKYKFSAYTAKVNILLDTQQVEEAKATIRRSIELGDERHSAYRQASDISHRLKDFNEAIRFANQAINAKNNSRQSRQNHKVHLANLLRITVKFDDALINVDENK
ncbi:tetratricopeptide repeat protein [Alteromonas sp. 1_MG-2023]|uniref:tetratricopeptide repeat protein n=1 Tax=Alteromonas sp. 1_MG-2023 TaxID=3062669 RepID=UPI0026E187E4|nr:tetratricopeptide repeat protein [Alteromonas sp. 1_MG-2023]MDO6569264.1 tetratricopeptide repeat protein [Alteromonas sp. 1_MG-2023]